MGGVVTLDLEEGFSKVCERKFKSKVSGLIGRSGVGKLMDWLENTDFYRCPASSRFHSAHEGGLVYHSLAVHETLLRLVDAFGLKEEYSPETLAIVSLFHDLCKVNVS